MNIRVKTEAVTVKVSIHTMKRQKSIDMARRDS